MPTFYQDVDVEVEAEVEIEVIDFLESCSEKETNELINYLIKEGYVIGVKNSLEQNIQETEFGHMLDTLSRNRLRLTSEEEELLKKIASRF